MPAEQVPQHLQGFAGYVAHVTGGGQTPAAQRVLQRLGEVKLVLGCVVEPGFDPGGYALRAIAAVAGPERGLVFAHNTVFDSDGSLLVGPPGAPPRLLPAELTPAQRWALATTAVVTHYFEEDHALLGGLGPDAEGRANARETLADPWGIGNTKELRDMLRYLSRPEEEQDFRQLAAKVAAGSAKVTDEVSAEDIAFVRSYAGELGERGLLAWDLCRLVYVAGKGYVAGWMGEAEAWGWILAAAQRLQRAYPGWADVGASYLMGVAWQRGPDDELLQAYNELLEDESTPWHELPWELPLQ